MARSTRFFNEISYPGIGGVGFVRQLRWATMGLRLAERVNESPMRLAEAIEALASYLAVSRHATDYEKSPRVRGRRKFAADSDDSSFERLSKRANYVSQPIRMGSGAGLIGLGLATGSPARFNSLELTPDGNALADLGLMAIYEGEDKKVGDWLHTTWIAKRSKLSAPKKIPTAVQRALLPGPAATDSNELIPTSDEVGLVKRLILNNVIRSEMSNAIKSWAEKTGTTFDEGALLKSIPSETQRQRVSAAITYQRVRHAALNVLQATSSRVAGLQQNNQRLSLHYLPVEIVNEMSKLAEICAQLLGDMKIANIEQNEAFRFCLEQSAALPGNVRLQSLVLRSKDYLTVVGECVHLGRLNKADTGFANGMELDESENFMDDDVVPNTAIPQRIRVALSLLRDVGSIQGGS